MVSGIVLQVFYGLVGSWTAYLISVLYIEYRTRKEKEGVSFKNHVIQVMLEIEVRKGWILVCYSEHFDKFLALLLSIPLHCHIVQLECFHYFFKKKLYFYSILWLAIRFIHLYSVSYCFFPTVVVWSSWWTIGSLLESSRACLQLYVPSVWICHTTNCLRKVRSHFPSSFKTIV